MSTYSHKRQEHIHIFLEYFEHILRIYLFRRRGRPLDILLNVLDILSVSVAGCLSWETNLRLIATNVSCRLHRCALQCSGQNEGTTVESFLKQHNVESNTAETVLKIVTTLGICSFC